MSDDVINKLDWCSSHSACALASPDVTQPIYPMQLKTFHPAIFDLGNYIISYQPQDGAPIEEFTQGDHTASVRYWNIQDGEQSARIYNWKFSTD